MASRRSKVRPRKRPAPATKARRPVRAGLTFNHAMIYTADVARALAFYRDGLGFQVVDEYPGGYARLVCPGSDATIALHLLDPGMTFDPKSEGLRLYFEVKDLRRFCERLSGRGVVFDQMPQAMPWGWDHAYLRDPDGHQISLYRAGAARLKPTRMRGGDH